MIAILNQCANPQLPGGGPKDELPPLVVKSKPTNYSTNFTSEKIEIVFDEFFTLDAPDKNIIISPPLEKAPQYRTYGKKLFITFRETLLPNTTYNIFFGDAIKDYNEGNVLSNYQYVFSTGNNIDSLSLVGQIYNAFTLRPEENAFVMLYLNNNDTIPFDSLPYKVKPRYVSKTNKSGQFILSNLAKDKYKIFTIKDESSSYIYNMTDQYIGFLDSLLTPEYIKPINTDTLVYDSLSRDTVKIERNMFADSSVLANNSLYTLFTFKENPTKQELIKAHLPVLNIAEFDFAKPVEDLQFECLNYPELFDHIYQEYSENNDTVKWYIENINVDTLNLIVKSKELLGDTLSLSLLTREERQRIQLNQNRRKKKERLVQPISIKNNTSAGILTPEQQLLLTFNFPIKSYNFDSVMLIAGEDTVTPKLSFADSIHRKLLLDRKLEEKTTYNLIFPDSSMVNILDTKNDSLNVFFSTRSNEDYGKILLTLNLPDTNNNFILELIDEKDNTKVKRIIKESGEYTFTYINPGNYSFRLTDNTSNSGYWEPGNYLQKRQAEKVYYFQKILNVKGNWIVDETWNIDPNIFIPRSPVDM
ncbi:MAG: Ig-like domain-containing protein [Hyphomicrobiales bacterium]